MNISGKMRRIYISVAVPGIFIKNGISHSRFGKYHDTGKNGLWRPLSL